MTRALLALNMAVVSAMAGEPSTDWQSVMGLRPGIEVTVERTDGKKLKGKLLRASPETLILSGSTGTVEANKPDILRVWMRRRTRAVGPVLGGAALGAIPGAMLGRVVAPETGDAGGAAAGAFCVGIGAGVGLLVWAISKPASLVYEPVPSSRHDAAGARTPPGR